MKHSRCQVFTDDVLSSHPTFDQGIKSPLRAMLQSMNKLLAHCVVFVTTKWYGDIISRGSEIDRWIVATNRESERFISILKQCLHVNENMRPVIINAYMRLRFLKFTFANDIPAEKHLELIRLGRDGYNESTTRKEVNIVKKEAYDKKMELELLKAQIKARGDNILKFMTDCGAEIEPKVGKNPGKASKVKATVENMKQFLGKLKRHKLYEAEVNQRLKDDYFRVIEDFLMPLGAKHFRNAYITKTIN
jgi:hypothetical protein